MYGMPRQTALAEQSGYICLPPRKKFKNEAGKDPIQNKVVVKAIKYGRSLTDERMSLWRRLACITFIAVLLLDETLLCCL